MKIVEQSVQLIGVMYPTDDAGRPIGNAEQLIEAAARTCYRSEDKIAEGTAAPFIKMLKAREHLAMLEFGEAAFRIVCDRGVSHEIVRHRIASYAQESTRYCNYGKGKFGKEITVIEPPGLTEADKAEWVAAMADAELAYLTLIGRGVQPQIARSVLPTCLKTEIVMKANFREWGHFLKLRTAPAAHPQMREVAGMIQERLQRAAPTVFA